VGISIRDNLVVENISIENMDFYRDLKLPLNTEILVQMSFMFDISALDKKCDSHTNHIE